MKALLYLSLFFLNSCSSALKVSPGKCSGQLKLKAVNERAQKEAMIKVRGFGIGTYEIELDDYLKDQNVDCNKLYDLRFSIISGFWDQVISSIPLITQWTLHLEWDEIKAKQRSASSPDP